MDTEERNSKRTRESKRMGVMNTTITNGEAGIAMKYCRCLEPHRWQGDNYCQKCKGLISGAIRNDLGINLSKAEVHGRIWQTQNAQREAYSVKHNDSAGEMGDAQSRGKTKHIFSYIWAQTLKTIQSIGSWINIHIIGDSNDG